MPCDTILPPTGIYPTPHIVRTLVHDALAEYGAYGATLARILCGQTSPETAKSYEIHAERLRVEKAQQILSQIQKKTFTDNAPHAAH